MSSLVFLRFLLYNKNMNKKTYVQESLRNGRIMRWTMMPLKVYVAPMKFYSKQGEDYKYRGLVKRALDEWQAATKGRVSFTLVGTLLESNINVDWKRVERKALGHCYFQFDAAQRLYSAEVSIGLTDGLIHSDYMDEGEVYHTILHEIGHAIGLGHSPYKSDIMYTPHQKGVNRVSEGDVLTVNWLYKLPQGAKVSEVASQLGVGGYDIDDIITKYMNKASGKSQDSQPEHKKVVKRRDLLEEQEKIALLRKYHLTLQSVSMSEELKKYLKKPQDK